MLTINIPAIEFWNERTQEFVASEGQTLQLEHSLVSLSKWESKWKKPFLGKGQKTEEETIDYIKCMTITKNVNDDVYDRLTNENIKEIMDYIDDPMTATTFREDEAQKRNNKIATSEMIYYWMCEFGIYEKCERWHLNRLLTLIRVCSIENSPKKNMPMRDVMRNNTALNAARRKALNSKG